MVSSYWISAQKGQSRHASFTGHKLLMLNSTMGFLSQSLTSEDSEVVFCLPYSSLELSTGLGRSRSVHTLDKATDFENIKVQDNLHMTATTLNTSTAKTVDKKQWWARKVRSQFLGKKGSKKKGDKSSFRDGTP